MRYLSTFTGIGGFEYGIQSILPKAECIGYSEVDGPAIKTYEEHYEHKNYGDITTINPSTLPDFDLIVGGFPCQAFSVAGKRRGFDEARGTLFFDVARILADKRPGHLVLENVKGLLSHDGGKTIQTIVRVLTDLGYRVEWQVLNSKNFGVPQNRERIYIVGHLRDGCGGQIFPLGLTGSSDNETSGETPGRQQVSRTLRSHQGGIDIDDQLVVEPQIISGQPKYGGGKRSIEYVLSDEVPTIRATHHKNGDNQPRGLEAARIRRLTPRECERLQGFPDDWTIGSDTQRYKQCGNAVTTNVVAAVMYALRDCLA